METAASASKLGKQLQPDRIIFMNGSRITPVLAIESRGDMPNFAEPLAASGAAVKIESIAKAEAFNQAFGEFVTRHSQFVFRVAYSVLRNVQDAEDIAQETFLKLYRLNRWRHLNDERAFLARAAWRLAVGRVKRNTEDLTSGLVDTALNAEASLIQEDSESQLHRLINALPLELRLPLALSTVDEMTSPQIAKIMSIPEGTVRTRLARAREILRKKLSHG